ncbi:DUF3349 domain-containing protein [Lapillicoccus sp.]|uniref:DUF3349 domain-containing protein n=1 Tax=Lapillicoccus sp. TaxID=1909287 RepID=UPI003263B05F
MALARSMQSVVTFLREGYPDGVPVHDYQPLFALLRRQLSPEEVALVARELAARGDAATADAIEAAIRSASSVVPTDADIARVQAHLSAGDSPATPPAQ